MAATPLPTREKCLASLTPEDCSICYEAITSPSKTSCGHIFCIECATKWFQSSNTCPCCRTQQYETSAEERYRQFEMSVLKRVRGPELIETQRQPLADEQNTQQERALADLRNRIALPSERTMAHEASRERVERSFASRRNFTFEEESETEAEVNRLQRSIALQAFQFEVSRSMTESKGSQEQGRAFGIAVYADSRETYDTKEE